MVLEVELREGLDCIFYFCFVHIQNDTYGSSLLVSDFSILIMVSYGVICASFTDFV